jgi:membrane protease YdiL (CAAX protease family)
MDEQPPVQGPAVNVVAWSPGVPPSSGRRRQEGRDEASRSPVTDWPWWTAPVALVGGVVLAGVAGLLVDIPALALGVNITASHLPPGLEIADTVVQDIAFVFAAVFCAQLGGRTVKAWQFGLRPPGRGWASAAALIFVLMIVFLIFTVAWGAAFHAEKEKVLEQLGTGENTTLLLLSAVLTCVIAPIGEEFLFRGFIFTALRNWIGTLPAAVITALAFGLVHFGSAPAVDLVPLAGLGFGLCLLYRWTGSLYPCIAAHSLNNSLAFGSLEGWGWQIPVLMIAALALAGLLGLLLMRLGVITPEGPPFAREALAVAP